MNTEPQLTSDTPTEATGAGSQKAIQPTATARRSHTVGQKLSLALGAAILCGLAGFGGGWAWQATQDQPESALVSSGIDGNAIVTESEQSVAAVATKVSPSVVSIVTKSIALNLGSASESEGAGTGVIVTQDGYVMTNNHVIEGAAELSIITSDGTTYDDISVIGSDPLNDVAFLKIKGAKNLTAAELGDSSSVRIGQDVVAIGNSLGQYQNTVTNGIISGTGRPVSAQSGTTVETLTDLLQTDAAINPGNSGGPLVNMAGQVIGINTAIAADAQGIGFSIPINATKGILKGVIERGTISRAYLGVNYISITPEVVSAYDLSVKQGAYVSGSGQASAVVSGGPADKAGVKDKDIIQKINDKEVGPQGGVASLIGEYEPGQTIKLTILRDGKVMTLNVTLDAYGS